MIHTGRFFAAALAVAALAGCANTSFGVKEMQRHGELRIETIDDAPPMYRVTLRNGTDIGYDPDRIGDRLQVVRLALEHECKDVEVLDTEAIATMGKTIFGRSRITYVMKVKCSRA
jgi:hypothetical protein